MVSLDLRKALFPGFRWRGSAQGWDAGCANDFRHVATGTAGQVADIRSPCVIHNADGSIVGHVGLAERTLDEDVGGQLAGPRAVVHVNVDSFYLHDREGHAVDPDRAGISHEYSFTNHPGTHAIGQGLANVPAGVTLHLIETISVSEAIAPPSPAPTPTPSSSPPSGCGHLAANDTLERGQAVESCDHRYRLIHQDDSNVVLYATSGNRAPWSSCTSRHTSSRLIMQGDGNLVLYSRTNDAVWHTHTAGHPGARLAVQDDGNVVVYSSSGHALWNTHTEGR